MCYINKGTFSAKCESYKAIRVTTDCFFYRTFAADNIKKHYDYDFRQKRTETGSGAHEKTVNLVNSPVNCVIAVTGDCRTFAVRNS